MSGQVKIIIAMAISAVASGAAANGVQTTLTDAAGNKQAVFTPVADFPTPAADGTFSIEADFSNVASGAFSGTVTATDANGDALADAVTFSDTATNQQPIPVSVKVAFA